MNVNLSINALETVKNAGFGYQTTKQNPLIADVRPIIRYKKTTIHFARRILSIVSLGQSIMYSNLLQDAT